MKFGVRSHKGMVREINEDSYNVIAGYPGIPVSFLIADGMGGHNSGEVASKAAVDFASNYILQFSGILSEGKDTACAIKEVMEKTNAEVYAMSRQLEANYGMGTTLIIAVVSGKKLFIGNVGDSRVYLIRGNRIRQLTTDHSLIEELIKSGSLTKEEAENHPKKHIITRALGCMEQVEVDTYTCDIRDNDVFLLCTDGLTNMLGDKEIKEIIEKTDDPELACDELVNRANMKGGEDNITVIVFKSV